jgi:hypothetical protein
VRQDSKVKEQQRKAKAQQKRELRQQRRRDKTKGSLTRVM